MAATNLPLTFEQHLVPPSYNWFGEFDYGWFGDSGVLSLIPFFEAAPEQLDTILQTSSARGDLTLTFGPRDCTTTSGFRNCTEACADPSSLFTPTNFRVCTALAGAALLVQNGTYAIDRGKGKTAEVMDSWGIPELLQFNGTGVFAQVAHCLPESCILSTLGNCADAVRDLHGLDINAGSIGAISSSLGHYCDEGEVEVNADIAGPGVMLSYFIQTTLAVLFFLMLKVTTTWTRGVGVLFPPKKSKRLANVQDKLFDSRLRAAVTSSLVEFQEVQIYFIAAVQIATLVSFEPEITDTVGENNSSYAAVILNSGLAALLNVTAITGVLLVQCSLQRAGVRWWYIFCLFTMTCIIGAIIFGRRTKLMPSADGLWEMFKHDAPLPQCGHNPSPMTFCRPRLETRFLDTDIAGWMTSILGGLIWVGLLLDQMIFKPPKPLQRFLNWDPNPKQRHPGPLQGRRKFWKMAVTAYWAVSQVLLLFLAIYYFSVLALIAEDVDFNNAGAWGFGQLIAVTVWVPTIVKFMYFNAFGVKEGFEERIAKNYLITKLQDESKNERGS
ncbi:hypothetical protein B0T16DRAFT_396055 [Cercophora newfieldiana]|uniref:Uncharacterized protein n=1 Tax=Cercophora newfieldiana TaxID=92897 RepID=A0AA40CXH7_9PEZI|nr:hypothetical protein B0T16DRAFT_396055 [Cercophora newfieldiana]